MTDDELIERIQDGDERCAGELVERYYAAILRYCRWHCADIGQAEDLTQETFLRLFRNLAQYRGKNHFKSYLYTIAAHLCIDESRKTVQYAMQDEQTQECAAYKRLEDRDEIERLLDRLSREQREAVLLRYGEELSYADIARVMGCTMRTAQSRVRCALEIMRKGRKR